MSLWRDGVSLGLIPGFDSGILPARGTAWVDLPQPKKRSKRGKSTCVYRWHLLRCVKVDLGFLVCALPGPGQPWGRWVAQWDILSILLRAGQGGPQHWDGQASKAEAGLGQILGVTCHIESKISRGLLHPAGPTRTLVPLGFSVQELTTTIVPGAHSHPDLQGDSLQVAGFLHVTSRPGQDQQLPLNLSAQSALGYLPFLQFGAKSSTPSSSWSPGQGRAGHKQGLIPPSPSFGVGWWLPPLLAGLQMLCSRAVQGDPSFARKAELEGLFFSPPIWP